MSDTVIPISTGSSGGLDTQMYLRQVATSPTTTSTLTDGPINFVFNPVTPFSPSTHLVWDSASRSFISLVDNLCVCVSWQLFFRYTVSVVTQPFSTAGTVQPVLVSATGSANTTSTLGEPRLIEDITDVLPTASPLHVDMSINKKFVMDTAGDSFFLNYVRDTTPIALTHSIYGPSTVSVKTFKL